MTYESYALFLPPIIWGRDIKDTEINDSTSQ